MNTQLELDCADICLPDYWQGTKLPHIAVMVDNTTTIADMLDQAHAEVRAGHVGSGHPIEHALDPDWCAAAHAAIDMLHAAASHEGSLRTVVTPHVDPAPDGCYGVYAYLVFHPVN